MPLSEEERRILSQIEERFYADDPEFAREVGQTTLYRHAFRNIKWGLLGVVVGLAVLVLTLSISFLLSFAGFLLVFASAVFIERNARRLGRAGLDQITSNMGGGSGSNPLGGLNQKMRDRFRREDDGGI